MARNNNDTIRCEHDRNRKLKMKTELTSIELRFLTTELQELVNGKIDQIYQPKEEELLLQIHVPSQGKQLLHVVLPSFIYLTAEKPDIPAEVSEFCSVLRDHLINARIREIAQVQNERIIEIVLEKEMSYTLVIELFSKGNIILCQNNKILFPLLTQIWKDRTIRAGKKYIFPERKYNPFDKNQFLKAIKNNEENTISKLLAAKLGLGKTYAEELCMRTNVDKLAKKIKEQETEKLFLELNKLIIQPINARVIYQNKEIFDAVPIALKLYEHAEQQRFNTYNEALESAIGKLASANKKTKAAQKFIEQLERIETKIEKQKQTLARLEKEVIENQRKGELIYENYQKVKESLAGRKRGERIQLTL